MNKPPEDEPFLSRWSRRKREVAGQSTAGPVQGSPSPSSAPVGDGDAAGEEPLDLETLPRIEDLDENSDISVFLDKRVPAMLRNAALSRMWTLDPTIRDFIEVAENQWNWNVPGGAPFYEEISGSAEIAQSIVEGGGGMLREGIPQLPPAGGPERVSDANTLVEQCSSSDDASQQVETATHRDLAAHNPVRSPGGSEGYAPNGGASCTHVSTEGPAGGAVQQASEMPSTEGVVRRRHGGALPA